MKMYNDDDGRHLMAIWLMCTEFSPLETIFFIALCNSWIVASEIQSATLIKQV